MTGLFAATARRIADIAGSITVGSSVPTIAGGLLAVGATLTTSLALSVRIRVGKALADGRVHVSLCRSFVALTRSTVPFLGHRRRVPGTTGLLRTVTPPDSQ
jgi:hypothetical protein